MKTNSRRINAGFTLIEVLAVITIIMILAGIVVGGMGFVGERQDQEKAKVQVALLSKALEEYKLDMGIYPPTEDSLDGTKNSAEALYIPLFYEGWEYTSHDNPPTTWVKSVGSNDDFPKSTRIYLADLDPTSTKQGWVDRKAGAAAPPPSSMIKDPWKREYAYRTATSERGSPNDNTQNPDFDLWSYGKDGKTNPKASHKDSLDDIRNF